MPDEDARGDPAPRRVLIGPASIYYQAGQPAWLPIGTTTASLSNAEIVYRRAGEPPIAVYNPSTITGTSYTITPGTNTMTFTTTYGWAQPQPQQPLTEANREAARQRRADRDRRIAEEAAEQRAYRERWQAATGRARALLEAHLDTQQLADYREHAWFEVTGSAGTRFRIGAGTVGNVHVYNAAGAWVSSVCAHPGGHLPDPDVHLAQMIALCTDERAFIAVANCQNGNRVRYGDDGRIVDPTRDAPTACEWELPGEGPVVVSEPVEDAA